MEALNKIWINTNTINGYYMLNHPPCGEEYIRKDALMEWTQEKLQEKHATQFRDAIGQLIDKLESL